jgi:hypothetical protein
MKKDKIVNINQTKHKGSQLKGYQYFTLTSFIITFITLPRMQKTNKLCTVLAFIFLYLSLVIPGPLYFIGNVFVNYPCMLCVETEEYLQFIRINHYLRGFFSLSVALIIYAQWTRIVAVIVVVAIIYSPLNDLNEYILAGEYHAVYLVFPLIFNAFSEPSITWGFYNNYEMFLMLIGTATALISYALIHKFSNNNLRIVIPVFALFIIGFSGIYIYIFEQPFQMITTSTGILFTLGVMIGLRYFIIGTPNKSFNSTQN